MIVIVLLYVIVKCCFLQSFQSLFFSSTQCPRYGRRVLNNSPGLQHQVSLNKERYRKKKTTIKKRRRRRGGESQKDRGMQQSCCSVLK